MGDVEGDVNGDVENNLVINITRGYIETEQLLNIKKTQLQMIRDRGFPTPGEDAILDMTSNQFIRYLTDLKGNTNRSQRSLLARFYVSDVETRRTVLVFYADKTPQKKTKGKNLGKYREKVLKGSIQPYVAILRHYMPQLAILILPARMGSQARDFLNEELLKLPLIRQELFYDLDLTYNPTYHVDVPIHELIPKEQVAAKLQELKVNVGGLLIMKMDDAIAKYYGWLPGSLIRIRRQDNYVSVLSPDSINYRILIQ